MVTNELEQNEKLARLRAEMRGEIAVRRGKTVEVGRFLNTVRAA